jgi:hypothetical protein
MGNNLGNVAGVVISSNPPLEADGITEKRYVLWAKPEGQAYDLKLYDRDIAAWVNMFNIIDDAETADSNKTFSKAKLLPYIQNMVLQANIVNNLTSTATNFPLSANQGKILNEIKLGINAVAVDSSRLAGQLPSFYVNQSELNTAIATSAYGIKYTFENETERLAQTGMKQFEQGVQIDTREVYKYNGSVWTLMLDIIQKLYQMQNTCTNLEVF